MNYDRLLEGFPAMRKRVKTHGIGSGRLINVYVVISENCNIGYKEMLNKAYTAIQIVDMLENMGYRVAIYACDSTRDAYGSWREETGVIYEVRVCLKKHEDSMNKGLILNGISPWFFVIICLLIKKAITKMVGEWGMLYHLIQSKQKKIQ